MSEFYFMNQQIVTLENSIVIESVESDVELEPVNLLRGAKLNPEPSYINIHFSKSGGNFYPDIVSLPITLYSDKIRTILDQCGIDNIDYYPVKLVNPPKNKMGNITYWFANICGRISCLDKNRSDITIKRTGVRFKSFYIDETKTLGAKLFRLHEQGQLVIIHESVYSKLSNSKLTGIVMKNTKDYDGHGI